MLRSPWKVSRKKSDWASGVQSWLRMWETKHKKGEMNGRGENKHHKTYWLLSGSAPLPPWALSVRLCTLHRGLLLRSAPPEDEGLSWILTRSHSRREEHQAAPGSSGAYGERWRVRRNTSRMKWVWGSESSLKEIWTEVDPDERKTRRWKTEEWREWIKWSVIKETDGCTSRMRVALYFKMRGKWGKETGYEKQTWNWVAGPVFTLLLHAANTLLGAPNRSKLPWWQMLKGEENTGQATFLRKQGKMGFRESGDHKAYATIEESTIVQSFLSVKAPERHNASILYIHSGYQTNFSESDALDITLFKIPNNHAKEIEFFKSSDEGRERNIPRKINKLSKLNKQEFAEPGPEAELVLSPRLLITSLW